MSFFLYKFVPRPDFRETMTDAEKAVMHEHVGYWQGLADKRTAVVFGPVDDPVVVNELGPVDIYPMVTAITRA